MDNTIALSVAAVVLTLIIVLLNFLKKQLDLGGVQQNGTVQAAAAGGREERDEPVRRVAAVRQRLRNRLAQQQRNDQQERGGHDSSEEEQEAAAAEGGAPAYELDLGDAKVGKKKLAKLEAKAEKKAAREAEEREREERRKKALEEEEERKKREEEERRLEVEEEARLKREEEERQRREHEAYLALKASFVVEEQGFDAEETAEDDLLGRFVEHVRTTKIVLLEELAATFGLKTQDAIDRLQKLVADGTLTGVIDDRGKFIYVSRAEMEAVARFIRQRGRVSLLDLAESSNQLIEFTA